MALPTSYLTSTKNLEGILNAIQGAKAPARFTQSFLESLGFKGTADRLVVPVLRSLGLLGPNNEPTERYHRFLDQSQAPAVMAEAIEDAYADLFSVNTRAHQIPRAELKSKFRTLTQGQISESVAEKMAMTFEALVKLADFAAPRTGASGPKVGTIPEEKAAEPSGSQRQPDGSRTGSSANRFGGFVYTIEIHLPESRDPAVYDALFQSMRSHLLD